MRAGGRTVILYPAIDIIDGQAVRLVRGDFEAKTVYGDDPLEAARGWVQEGATHLHVVDLDGARTGTPQSLEHLERIARELGVPVQYGGGLRSPAAVRDALAAGADRVILGTAALTDPDFLDEVLAELADRTTVSVDTRGGLVSTAGWTETTTVSAADVIEGLQDRGVRSFVFTDVDRDGMLDGPDLEAVRRVADAVGGRWIYSGGIGSVKHLETLAHLRLANLAGVVTGKALYEKRFTVAEGQAALRRG